MRGPLAASSINMAWSEVVDIQVWWSSATFPEAEPQHGLRAKADTGVCLSGGGYRAYTAAVVRTRLIPLVAPMSGGMFKRIAGPAACADRNGGDGAYALYYRSFRRCAADRIGSRCAATDPGCIQRWQLQDDLRAWSSIAVDPVPQGGRGTAGQLGGHGQGMVGRSDRHVPRACRRSREQVC